MYADFAVQCTWEGEFYRFSRRTTCSSYADMILIGDNTILSLQSGRALISSWADAKKGKTLSPGVAYMAEKSNMNAKSTGKLDLQDIDQAWACVATNVVKKAAEDFAGHVAKGSTKDEAMEKCSQSRFIAAKLHTIGYVSFSFRIRFDKRL